MGVASSGRQPLEAVSRRQILKGIAGAAAAISLASCSREEPEGYTLAAWRREPGDIRFIAHRGSGDIFPEHTLEAYEGSLAWGAKALEISVVMTSDGVLLCQHDLTFDRTTNLNGKVATQPSSVLLNGRVGIPRLGPRWQGEGRPRIARLEDVLRRLGKRAVLFIEPKDDAAFPGIVRLVQDRGLTSSVMMKLHYATSRIEQAREAGLPVFCYLGAPEDVTPERVKQVSARLDPEQDVLVIPAADDHGPLADDKVALAVATGLPVWVFPVHRRWEVEHFAQRGIKGIITSSYGYTSKVVQPAHATDWVSGAIAPGEMTRFPDSTAYGLEWPEPGVIRLAIQRRQAFLTLGQLAPLERPSGPYQISLEIRVDDMPSDAASNFTIAFGHSDDRYYEHQLGEQDGYHAIMRMDGTLELRIHRAGSDSGEEIAKKVVGPAPQVGTWIPLRLSVDPTIIGWARADTGGSTSTEDSKFRGGYFHIGRSATDGKISVRNLQIG